MRQCVLLNADYTFLSTVNWKQAIRLMLKKKVEVIRFSNLCVQGVEGFKILLPAVMRLSNLIQIIYRTRIPFSKKNVMIRDGFQCVYCGVKQKKLTIDHVVPKSRGGETSFKNCVACCRRCNAVKGDRSLHESKMVLKKIPNQPTLFEWIQIKRAAIDLEALLKPAMEET